ncbi:peptide ABC transporter substrate-binding protein [Tahibacter amnicola]|uniref:Peptide ABC transporter substrate-binding protein n=1 Tax=Tahibacter amnicola TaxID=2976241 RepID=A0ABY6BHV8_9GAMM|nr:peptide ABC transporter substrate-binding protein [Tahibacter amnicola]UXI68201.1 peptide ABC transporter substrate-binding protein [Tahibacter amnicola]
MRLPTLVFTVLLTLSPAASSRELIRGNGPEPATLDVHRCQEVACGNLLRDLYEGLVTEGADGAIIAGAARSWRVSDDGRQWQFRLRDELCWSNGEALTAQDFVASLRRAVTPQTAAPMAQLLRPIANASAILRGEAAPESLGVTAVDAHTLHINLDEPVPLLDRLALPIAMPVYLPAIAVHGVEHTRPGRLVGNGAYRLSGWTPHASVEMEKNTFFHAATDVAIARVRYVVTEDAGSELQRFLAGDVHITETVPPKPLPVLRAQFGERLRISPYVGSFWFGLNLTREPFRDNPALREALVLAVDRDILTRHITGLGEQPAFGIVPPGTRGHAAPVLPMAQLTPAARVARARERYAAAGYSADRPAQLEIRYNTSTLHRKLALAVAAMWRQTLGAQVRLRNEEWKVFVQNRRARVITQVFRGGWIADVNDPLDFLATFSGPDNPLNTTGFADPEFDAALTRAALLPDGTERTALLTAAEARVLSAHAVVPLYFYSSKHLVDDRLEGFAGNPLDHHATRWMRWRDGEAP